MNEKVKSYFTLFAYLILLILVFYQTTNPNTQENRPFFTNNSNYQENGSTLKEPINFNPLVLVLNDSSSSFSVYNVTGIPKTKFIDIRIFNGSCSSISVYYFHPEHNVLNGSNLEIQNPIDGLASELGKLLPTIIGGLIALIGVLITHLMNEKREARKSNFEWGKFLFERYEQYYRIFIHELENKLNPSEIEISFNKLNEMAYVPRYLKNKVKETCTALKSDISREEKENLRNKLLSEFEKFIHEPWKFNNEEKRRFS